MTTRPRSPAGSQALGRERILKTALALIDAHGLAAFNLRDLAGALGVYPTAIYWHVPGRNALIAGAVALAMQDAGTAVPGGTWQVRLRSLLQRFRAALRAHPRLAPIVASELVYNAALDAVLLDHVVCALEDAGFSGGGLVDTFNVVIAAMCGFATLELSAPPDQGSEGWEAGCRERLSALRHDAHPALARHLPELRNKAFMLRWSSGTTHPLNNGFAAWCEVFIAGLEARAASLRIGSHKARQTPAKR
jgi:AcrR family transcriptional regulator